MVGASGGVTLLSPPTPGSSGAGCWGGGCSRPRCHGNHPNPHFPKHKETALTPAPRKNLGLVGNLPWGTLFLMQEPRPEGRFRRRRAGPLRPTPPSPQALLSLTYSQGRPGPSQLQRPRLEPLLFPRSEGSPLPPASLQALGTERRGSPLPPSICTPPPLLIRHSAPSFRSLSLICIHLHNTAHLHSRRLVVGARNKGAGD